MLEPPRGGGQLREVPAGGLCRNYRPRPAEQPDGALRRLNLANGQFVLVDAADYEWLRHCRWTMRSGYACRRNNYRSNLRICIRAQRAERDSRK